MMWLHDTECFGHHTDFTNKMSMAFSRGDEGGDVAALLKHWNGFAAVPIDELSRDLVFESGLKITQKHALATTCVWLLE